MSDDVDARESKRRSEVKIAIVGVGNCASSLVQGIEYYRHCNTDSGLITELVAGLKPSDIQVSAAFDIDRRKVGKPLSQAIHSLPNNSLTVWDGPLVSDPVVAMGPIIDGVADHMRHGDETCRFEVSREPPVNVVEILRRSGAELVVCYLPVGSRDAVRHYARAAADAGCGFINCVPVLIANDPEFAELYKNSGLPLIGDDIRSQVGATIVHQRLTELLVERGCQVESTYQLNFGGNTDFRNMLDHARLETKKKSKTNAVKSRFSRQNSNPQVHIGPSDFIPHLQDQKIALIELKGIGFAGAPMTIELKLKVWDSPNSAGVVVDLVRFAALALDRGEVGVITSLSSYYMKSPPVRENDHQSRSNLAERQKEGVQP